VEKICYLIWKPEGVTETAFRDQLIGETAEQLLACGVHKLSILSCDETTAPLEKARITQMEQPLAGMISVWVDISDDRAALEEAIDKVVDRKAGYLVVESVPTLNTTHTAPLGERTPGTTLLTCLTPKPDLTYDEFLGIWHTRQRKVAQETQCTYLYIRNVVVRALTPDAPAWAGIVEEGFPTEAVTDPMIWYKAEGSKEKRDENFGKMIASVTSFLDLSKIESHPTSEYLIK
jgi:hypothetical protein